MGKRKLNQRVASEKLKSFRLTSDVVEERVLDEDSSVEDIGEVFFDESACEVSAASELKWKEEAEHLLPTKIYAGNSLRTSYRKKSQKKGQGRGLIPSP